MLNRFLSLVGLDQPKPKSLTAKRKFNANRRRAHARQLKKPEMPVHQETKAVTPTSSYTSTTSLRNIILASLPLLASGTSCTEAPFNRVDFNIGQKAYAIMTQGGEMSTAVCYHLMSQILTKQFNITALIPTKEAINQLVADVCPSYFRKSYVLASTNGTTAELTPELTGLLDSVNQLSACNHALENWELGVPAAVLGMLLIVGLGCCIRHCIRSCELAKAGEDIARLEAGLEDQDIAYRPYTTEQIGTISERVEGIALDGFDVHGDGDDDISHTEYQLLQDTNRHHIVTIQPERYSIL